MLKLHVEYCDYNQKRTWNMYEVAFAQRFYKYVDPLIFRTDVFQVEDTRVGLELLSQNETAFNLKGETLCTYIRT